MRAEIENTLSAYLADQDVSDHTRRALSCDVNKLVNWFEQANNEPFAFDRVTVQDVSDFRHHLRHVRHQSVNTVNRALVLLRGLFNHLVQTGQLQANPAKPVKELKRMPATPKDLAVSEVRKVLREIELRGDARAKAVFGLMLWCGLRIGDVAGLVLQDIEIQERSGRVICRRGKGNKLRVVPMPLQARRAVGEYLALRPAVESAALFIGERGPLRPDGIRMIIERYAAICGVKLTPHTLRHTFAHRYLAQSSNDLAGLAQILGHENLNTTAIYTRRTESDLQQQVEEMHYS